MINRLLLYPPRGRLLAALFLFNACMFALASWFSTTAYLDLSQVSLAVTWLMLACADLLPRNQIGLAAAFRVIALGASISSFVFLGLFAQLYG